MELIASNYAESSSSVSVLDSLPYIDNISDQQEKQAQILINNEMKINPSKKDYLGDLNLYKHISYIEETQLIKEDFERMNEGKPFIQISENLPKPPNKKNDLSQWETSVENAKIKIENNNLQLLNLELLHNYGANANIAYNQYLQNLKEQLETVLEEIKTETETLNVQRKRNQNECNVKLNELKQQWDEITAKNIQIHEACTKLEAEQQQKQKEQ